MRTTYWKPLPCLHLGFGVLALVMNCLSSSVTHAQSADPFPATYADPAVPLLQLPTNFRARRTTVNARLTAAQPVEIFNATGAGCVRHMWFVFGEKNIEDLSIEITVDDAAEPQVRMPFRSFFGALLSFEDYSINSAGLVNFPNFTVTKDVRIPTNASSLHSSELLAAGVAANSLELVSQAYLL